MTNISAPAVPPSRSTPRGALPKGAAGGSTDGVSPEETIARLLALVGQPARLQIILALEQGGACCVCHLEAHLGLRQAAISQHLMLLRSAGLVETQREGRHIFYRLANPALSGLVRQASALAGIDPAALQQSLSTPAGAAPPCPCPHCNP